MNTFILKWNPEISSFTYENYLKLIDDPYEMYLNWSIYDWQEMEEGDRVFFLRVGEKPQLLASGFVTSEPYRDEDWSGKGRVVYYADMYFDFACHPEYQYVLTAGELEEQIPD